MRQRREQYAPHIEGGRTLDEFCEAEVEAMGVEADEPRVSGTASPPRTPRILPAGPPAHDARAPPPLQVQALAGALGLRVRVEYLDGQSVGWSDRCGPHRHRLQPA